MAEFKEPPTWKPGDLVTSEKLNIYSNNDLYFYEQLKNVGAGIFTKVKEVVVTEGTNVIDATDIHLKANKIYYCFLMGGYVPIGEENLRIYFNEDYEHTLYRTSYLLYKDYTLTANYDIGPYLSKARLSPPLFIHFKIAIVTSLGLWPLVIVEKHHSGAYDFPYFYEALIWYLKSTEIFSMRIEGSIGYFLPGTKLVIWESAFI